MRPPSFLHRTLHRIENAADRGWRSASRRFGRGHPRAVLAFTGWDNTHHTPPGQRPEAVFGCRVLTRPLGTTPREGDRWWHNLRNTWRRWNTQELPGAAVTAHLEGRAVTLVTDEEGYAWFQVPSPPATAALRSTVELHVDGPCESGAGVPPATAGASAGTAPHVGATVSAEGREADLPAEADRVRSHLEVVRPPAEARFAVVSDLDDTVIHTGITHWPTAAKLTFLHNAHNRTPLAGVAALYRALEGPPESRTPFFYVSSSAWNLHDLLTDFLRHRDLPLGPLLLQDLGLDRLKFIKDPGHSHKLDKARRLVDSFAGLPFVLFGDSGQADPHLYATLAKERPGRLAAIFIRDVEAETTDRDTEAERELEAAERAGVPSFLVRDSVHAAEHLVALGLLDEAAVPGVRDATEADLGKPLV